jgi:putative multiple sugar transport system permease protein
VPNWFGYIAGRDVVTLILGLATIVALVFTGLRARWTLRKHDLHVEPFGSFLTKNVLFGVLIGATSWVLAGSRGGSPIVLLIVAVLIVAYTFVMGRTVFGRDIYAIGGNLQAAILSGVNTKKVNFWVFVNIAACFIGGTAVTGGIGRVSGAIVGALIMGVLNMGLSIMAVDPAWQQVIKGLVLLAAVAFDLVNKRRAGGR